MLEETGTGHGFKITHEDDQGKQHMVEAHYNEAGSHRLDLLIDGHSVYLSEEESGYFLAWMATWYEQGDNEHKHTYRVSAGFITVRYCETCERSWVLANDNGWHWLLIPEAA